MAERTYYDVLQVSPSASDEEIKAAYRARAWQPAGDAGQEELKQINEAYATLSSPQRRVAYDLALATGAPPIPVAAAPAASPAVPPAGDEAEEERVPKGALPLRLWGMISDLVWHISRVRYVFIPFTWIIGGMLFFCALYAMDGYRLAVHPNAYKTTVSDVVREVPDQKYISVVAQADYDNGFTMTGSNAGEYRLLVEGSHLLLFKGSTKQGYGRFTGLLRAFDTSMAEKLKAKAAGSYWQGTTMLTTHYLDVDYLPGAPGWYLAGLAAALLGLAALVVPGLKRYTVFSAGPQRWDEPVGGLLPAQVRVEAAARFRRDGSSGWGMFHAGLPALLTPASEGGFAVSTWIRVRGTDELYQIMIPPRSEVRLGVDRAGGRARPALKVRAAGQTVYLRVESLRDARLLAQAIRG